MRGKTVAFYMQNVLHERLARAAKEEDRSVSSYLCRLLEKTLPPECQACNDRPADFTRDGVWYCAKCGEAVSPVEGS